MQSTYSISEAQAKLPALIKDAEANLITITRHENTVAYVVSAARMEAIAETLEIMADECAMAAIRSARSGKGRFHPLSALADES